MEDAESRHFKPMHLETLKESPRRFMPLDRLSNSVYAHVYPDPSFPDSNRGYIICDKYVVVVDAMYLLENVRNDLEQMRKLTDRNVRYLINTHYHSDHTYGNCLFDCEIIAHTKCIELMKQEREKQLSSVFEEVKDPEERKHIEGVRYPTVLFEESFRLDSDPAIEVIHLGGHTPDLSIVHIPEEKILFASDNLFGSRDPSTPVEPEMNTRSDLDQWILALEYVLTLDPKVIVPGHLGLCNKQAVPKLIDYLRLFVENVRSLKRQGYSKEQVKHTREILDLSTLFEGSGIDPTIMEGLTEQNIDRQYDRL